MKRVSIVTSIAIASIFIGCGSGSHHSKKISENNISASTISENNVSSSNSSIMKNNENNTSSNQNIATNSGGSYGYYGGGGYSGNSGSSNNQNSDQIEKSIKIENLNVKIAPSTNVNLDNKDAFTFSNLGIVAPVTFPTPEKVEETNESVEEVINNTLLKEKKKIYSISANTKVIKKPFTSADGKLAVLFEFKPKLKFDTTVAVTNYLTLLALPNNGLDLLKNGLEPIPEISGDIAFYNPDGDRKLDINKDFNSTNTTVDVYLFFKDVNLSEGNYKLYTYDYNGNSSVKEIKVAPKTKKVAVAMKNVSSFVIAKPSNKIETITEIVDNTDLPSDLKMGIVALNGENRVVGVGEFDGGVANIYTLETPSKYIYVSYFLKDGKKTVTNLNDISLNDFDIDKYPLDFSKLTQNDKNILYNIKQIQEYNVNWNIVADMIKPEKLVIKNEDSDSNFSKDVTTFIEDYIIDGECNTNLKKEYNLSYEDIEILKESCKSDNLILEVKFSYKNEDDSYNRFISIKKNKENSYKISYKVSSSFENGGIDYDLLVKPYGRILKNSEMESSVNYSDIYYSNKHQLKGELKYIGDNNYLYTYSDNVYSQYNYEAKSEILKYRIDGVANIFYNMKVDEDILKNNSYEVSDIYSNEENVTINGKNFVFNYSNKTKETSINMYVENKPVTYNSNTVTFGNRKVEFYRIGSSKAAKFNIEENVTSNTTYKDFANIKLPDVNSSSLVGKDGKYDIDLTLIVEDLNGDNKVMFKIDNAVIDVYDNELSLLMIPNQTKILAYQEGLTQLSKIKSGETKIAELKNELINKDLEFNIDTLLDNLATNSDALKITLNELNKYLIQLRKYQVVLQLDTELPLTINTIKGIVKVNKK